MRLRGANAQCTKFENRVGGLCMTSCFLWFLSSVFFAAISVGISLGSINWGFTTMLLLFAIRNAVMVGYFEGRGRYEYEIKSALQLNRTEG
jgi:tetrahydromethanopterin S-methyltransferase subunit E